MRAYLFIYLGLLFFIVSCKSGNSFGDSASDHVGIKLMFYNVENLFDTEDDPNIHDEEFTPEGVKAWTLARYEEKLSHLSRVLASAEGGLPDIIGLCEVENAKVVKELAATEALSGEGYVLVHKDSPDGRGIDCALLINPKKVRLLEEEYIETKLPIGERPNTRLIQHATLLCGVDTLHVFVNHWPSRYGGAEKSEPNRLAVAMNLRTHLDDLLYRSPDAQIVIMGDFNDYPNNKSLNKVLRAGEDDSFPLQNLMWNKQKNGEGSYNYKGEWGCLDQFIVSQNLVNGDGHWLTSEAEASVLKKDWMLYINNKGQASPSRTYGGPNYYGGYSDHLPVELLLEYIK